MEVAFYLEDMAVLAQGRGMAAAVRLKKPPSFFDQLLSFRRANRALWKPHLFAFLHQQTVCNFL